MQTITHLLDSAHSWQWAAITLLALFGLGAEWRLRVRNTAWARILPPLGVLVTLFAVHAAARGLDWGSANVVRGAMVLVGTLLAIRVSVYALRQAFESHYESGVGVFATFERAIAWALWALAALTLTGGAAVLWQGAQGLALPIGRSTVSLAEVLSALLAAGVTVLAALWLAAVIERRLMQTQGLESNTKVVLGRLVKAVLLALGVVAALAVGGIDLTLFSVLFGALGVGLGFGLQKIAASYVSGFIVLLDKGIKIGDMITVDKHYGRVTHIHARYTVIRTFDSTEALIPNELIVSSPIVNHSYSSSTVKVTLPITVGYDCDLNVALLRLEHHASAQPRVVAEPAPYAMVHSFAADGLALELSFWIADPENGRLNVRSDVARAVWQDFKERGITLPYPQRTVYTVSQSLS